MRKRCALLGSFYNISHQSIKRLFLTRNTTELILAATTSASAIMRKPDGFIHRFGNGVQ